MKIKVGDTVRIIDDEFTELVGLIGIVEQISPDGTTAWVGKHIPVLFSVSNLEKVA